MAKTSEYLKEALLGFAWLGLFLLTYALFQFGAAFVVHGIYGVWQGVILGLPNLGIEAQIGPSAAREGRWMIGGGILMLALSIFTGRVAWQILAAKAKAKNSPN